MPKPKKEKEEWKVGLIYPTIQSLIFKNPHEDKKER